MINWFYYIVIISMHCISPQIRFSMREQSTLGQIVMLFERSCKMVRLKPCMFYQRSIGRYVHKGPSSFSISISNWQDEFVQFIQSILRGILEVYGQFGNYTDYLFIQLICTCLVCWFVYSVEVDDNYIYIYIYTQTQCMLMVLYTIKEKDIFSHSLLFLVHSSLFSSLVIVMNNIGLLYIVKIVFHN